MTLDMEKEYTIGELYGPAMKITDQDEADAYLEQLIKYIECHNDGKSPAECEGIARSNLGYYAGYYNSDTRSRVERLFDCRHPIFGKVDKVGPPTPEEAFAAGMEAGRQIADERRTTKA